MSRGVHVAAVLAGLTGVLWPRAADAVGDRPAKPAWGTIRGQITYGGKTVPSEMRLDLRHARDRAHVLSAGPLFPERLVVNPRNRGVRWVLVFLTPEGNKSLPIHPDLKKAKGDPVMLQIQPGRFEPHVLALRRGQTLTINNPERIVYNVNWWGVGPQAQSGTVLIRPRGTHAIRDLKPEPLVIAIRDSIHPWMKAWLKIFDHPYFAITDADGKFTIPQAPSGTYRLVSWQESIGWGPGGKAGVPVQIQGKSGAVVKLILKPRDE
jgi:hypothetical protein